jgi:DNA polymerase III alpha subunit
MKETAGYTTADAIALLNLFLQDKYIEIEKQNNYFIQCARQKGFNKNTADYIFNILRSLVSSAEWKADLISEGLLDYQLAYLEEHFPEQYRAIK